MSGRARRRAVCLLAGALLVPMPALPRAAAFPSTDAGTAAPTASSSDVPLTVAAGHLVIDVARPDEGVVGVSEVWLVRNATRETRVADGDGSTLTIALPSGALNIALPDERLRSGATLAGDTVSTTAALAPGAHQVVVTYDLPYLGRGLSFARRLDLPVDELRVLALDPDVRLAVDGLGPASTATVAGRTVLSAAGTRLDAGATLTVRLDGLEPALRGAAPAGAFLPARAPLVGQDDLASAGAVLLVLAMASALAYPWWSSRKPGLGRTSALHTEYDALVAEIAVLDDARPPAGRETAAAHAVHAADRAALVARALRVAAQLDRREGER